MKTKLCVLALAVMAWCNIGRAQNSAAPARPGDSRITLDKMAAVSSNPLGVSTNIVPIISIDSETPLQLAIEKFASDAQLKFRYAPELMPGGKPSATLAAPVGQIRWEGLTAFEALQRLVQKNDLVLGRMAGSPDVLIGTKQSGLQAITPVAAMAATTGAGGELDRASEDEFVFSDPSARIPLETAITLLARLAKIPILFDPRLRTGGERVVGTNVVMLPSITNVTVNLSSMGDLSMKQRLIAILDVHDLAMVLNPASGVYTITYKEPGAKEPLVPNVIPLHYANATNIVSLLSGVFPAPTRIQADQRTAALLVVSTQKDYDAMMNLVQQLDTQTKQVLIEARFVDTVLNPSSFKGVDWTGTLKNNQITFGNGNTAVNAANSVATTTTPTTTPNGRPGPVTTTATVGNTVDTTTTVNPNNPGFSLNTANGFNPSTAFLNAQGVSAVLSFLNQNADTRTLSTPRAVTLDNQETRLEVTRAIPIFDQSEGIGQAGVTVSSSKPTYTNVGTILIVTPRISGTNVQMRLRPEISDTELQLSTKTVAGKVNQADIFTMQKIDTHVMIPSGSTLVMGGLSQDINSKGYTKVPVLGDIPVLGWAFRSESINRKKRNIFIFVTPTIIEDDDYQPYRTDFLNTQMPEHQPVIEDPMTSGHKSKFGKDKQKVRTAGSTEEFD